MADKKNLPNPFPGLRPFQSDEEHLFFGRENQTLELLKLLRDNRFVGVIGTSGSGKSSLVRCGLLSELYGGSFLKAGTDWEVAVMNPGGGPFNQLSKSLVDADIYDSEEPDIHLKLNATLKRSRLGLVEAIRQATLPEGTNFLLVVDQFEEIFRYSEAGEEQEEAADDFISMILEAAKQSNIPIYVIITMRSDYIGDCSKFEGLPEEINEGEYLIPRLSREEYKSVIEGPVRVGGAKLAPRLLQRLLNDIGTESDQLPCLQHALMRTWDAWTDRNGAEEVDLEDYRGIGGMSKALSIHADEIFDTFEDKATRETATRMFRAITEKGDDNRGIRRPLRLQQLADITDHSIEEVKSVVEPYRQQGVTFLMPPSDRELEADTVIDISHESLMRVWQRLRNWVEEEAQSARIYRRLVDTSSLWKKKEAGLYHDPDLQISQSWRDKYQPNENWADLYGGGFQVATEFLEASEEEGRKAEREKELARQKELKQAQELAETRERSAKNMKRFAAVVGVVAVIALAAMIFAVNAQKAAEVAKTKAQEAEREAIIAKDDVRIAFAKSDENLGHSFAEQDDSKQAVQYMVRSLEKERNNPYLSDRIFNLISYAKPYGYIPSARNIRSSDLGGFATTNDGKLYATASKFSKDTIYLPGQNYHRNIRESSLIDSDPSTKYVNFSREESGFYVTPDKKETTIKSLKITTSNNALEGDPSEITIFGTNDPTPHLGEGSYTMSAWLKPKRISQNQMIFGQTQLGIHLGIRNSGRLHQGHWGNDWNGQTRLPNYETIEKNKEWIHALWTWSGPDQIGKIYLDGKLEFEGSIWNPDNAVGSLIIGNHMDAKSNLGIPGYSGLIDEISIWSDVLEENDITALAEGKSPLEIIKWKPSKSESTTKFSVADSKQHLDNDNDNYSNSIEIKLGADPNDSESTPPKLIGYYNFEQANESVLEDLSPWKNNGQIRTPKKIKINQSGGAPSTTSPENCGEFADGILDIPGIKFVELYSGKFGIKPRWTKIDTVSTKLPAQRNKESEPFEISNNKTFNSYKVTFNKIRSPELAESVHLSEIKFFENSNSKGESIFSSSDKIDRSIENDKKEKNEDDSTIDIWEFGKPSPSLSVKLAEGATTWEGSNHSLDFNSNKTLLAIAYENHSHSEIISTQDGSVFQKIPIAKLSTVSFSSGGKKILLSNLSGRVLIWDLKSESIILEEEAAPNIVPKWSPDEKSLLLPNIKNNESALVNIKTKEKIILKHGSNVHNIASFSPDGTKILTLTRGDLAFNVWDIQTAKVAYRLQHSLGPHSSSHNNQQSSKWWHAAGTFSPDGNRIITFSDDMTVKLWDSINGKLLDQKNIISRIEQNSEPLFDQSGARFMIKLRQNNNCYLGTLKKDNSELPFLNKIFPTISGYAHLLNDGTIKPLHFPLGEVISAHTIKDDNKILLANVSGEISSYDLSDGKKINSITAQEGLKFTDISNDGNMIATSSDDGTTVVFSVNESNVPLLVVESLSQNTDETVVDISFDQSGENLWICRVKGPELWSIESKEILNSPNINVTFPYSISSDDKSLYTIFRNSSFRIYYRNEDGILNSYGVTNNSDIRTAAFTNDNKHLLLGSIDGVLNVWSLGEENKPTNRNYRFPEGLEISALASSSDNNQIAAGFVGGFIHLLPFDFTETTEPKKIITKGSCNDLSFSDDGSKLASVFNQSGIHTTRVWDTNSGYSVTGNLENSTAITNVTFTENGKKIITWPDSLKGGTPGIASLWEIGVNNGNSVSNDFLQAAKALSDNYDFTSESNENSDSNLTIINLINNLQTSEKISSDFKSFLSWTKQPPSLRSDSPFRAETTQDYINLLSKQNEAGLIKEALRLNPANAMAIARSAIFKLINEENLSAQTKAEVLLDIKLARELENGNSEIKWYEAIIIERVNGNDNPIKYYGNVSKETSITLNELLRVSEIQNRMNSNIEQRVSVLDSAISKINPQNQESLNKKLIVDRFLLNSSNNNFLEANKDWSKIISWSQLPIGQTAKELKTIYSNLIETEANRLAENEDYSKAADMIEKVALASLVDEGEVLSSSLVKLIEWENVDSPALQFIPKNEEWSYLDDGTDPENGNSDWRQPWFPEIDWKKGKAKLGYGDDGEETEITKGETENAKYLAYYFRHKFTVTEDSKKPVLVADIIRDDGAIVYLNGVEIHRSNMPEGEVDSQTTAVTPADRDGPVYEIVPTRFAVNPELLKIGENVIAAEIHQANSGSSDLGFQFELKGLENLPSEYILNKLNTEGGKDLIETSLASMPFSLREPMKRSLFSAFDLDDSIEPGSDNPELFKQSISILKKLGLNEKIEQLVTAKVNEIINLNEILAGEDIRLLEESLKYFSTDDANYKVIKSALTATPKRNPNLSKDLINLDGFYTASISHYSGWHAFHENFDLRFLPEEYDSTGTVPFDLRGILQLNSGFYPNGQTMNDFGHVKRNDKEYPDAIKGIKINSKAKRIHFLAGLIYKNNVSNGKIAAKLKIHFEDGSQSVMPLVVNKDIFNWWSVHQATNGNIKGENIGFVGQNYLGNGRILTKPIWENPTPEKLITHIDFESGKEAASPFIVAITIE